MKLHTIVDSNAGDHKRPLIENRKAVCRRVQHKNVLDARISNLSVMKKAIKFIRSARPISLI